MDPAHDEGPYAACGTSTVTAAREHGLGACVIYLPIGMRKCTGDTRRFWCAWRGTPDRGLRTRTCTARVIWLNALTPVQLLGMPVRIVLVFIVIIGYYYSDNDHTYSVGCCHV